MYVIVCLNYNNNNNNNNNIKLKINIMDIYIEHNGSRRLFYNIIILITYSGIM